MWNWLLFDIKTSNFPSENDQSSYKSKNTLASIFSQSQKKKLITENIYSYSKRSTNIITYMYIQCMFVDAAAEFMN